MTIKALGHNYVNGVCTRCGAKDPAYTAPVTPEPGIETPVAQTGQVHFPRANTYHQGQFKDVKTGQWFAGSVADAYAFGLMKGKSADSFVPKGDVTVAEAVTMAARIHSIYTTGTENFQPVAGAEWYRPYYVYARDNGIIDNYFYAVATPTRRINRGEFAKIFANALPEAGLPAINTVAKGAIPDVDMGYSYSDSVYKLYRAGILAGSDSKGTFHPDSAISRAECAAIVACMAESGNRVSITL